MRSFETITAHTEAVGSTKLICVTAALEIPPASSGNKGIEGGCIVRTTIVEKRKRLFGTKVRTTQSTIFIPGVTIKQLKDENI